MNLRYLQSDNLKEKMSISTGTKINFLLAMILIVTFEHAYHVLSFFTVDAWGKLSTAGLVVWLDFMMFMSLSMVRRESRRANRIFGWIVFVLITLISGLLNIYYMILNKPDDFVEQINQIIALSVGGIAPLGIVFLGMIKGSAEEHIAHAEVKRMHKAERSEKPVFVPPAISKERKGQVHALHAQGMGVSAIARQLNVSRQTVYNALKDV